MVDGYLQWMSRFRALGADFLVLVECKHHKSSIKRETVQVLHSRKQSVGAQKAMLFASSGFQKGALEFAKAHGIALVRVADGRSSYETRSLHGNHEPSQWVNLPAFVGWRFRVNEGGSVGLSLLSSDRPNYLDEFLREGGKTSERRASFPSLGSTLGEKQAEGL